MDKNFTNIEDKFREAFDSWEADFSPAEMKADWSQLSSKIAPPQAPAATQPVSKPFWGAGKMLGLISGAAVVATSAVILYNTYIYDGEKMPSAEIQKQTEVISIDTEIPVDSEALYNEATVDITLPRYSTDEYKQEQQSSGNSGNKNIKRNSVQNQNSAQSGGELFSTSQNPNLYLNPYAGSDKNALDKNNNEAQAPDGKQFVNTLNKKNLNFSDTVFCLGDALTVSYTGVEMPDAAVLEWGDGKMQAFTRINKHYYEKTGRYRIRIADGTRVIEKIISVTELPQASFTNYQCEKLQCKFRNNSSRGFTYVWNFGDGSPEVRDYHPEHNYSDTGKYTVVLKAYTSSGCVDSFLQQVRVSNIAKPVIPNVLTPNRDGENDKFTVKIQEESLFHIKIFELSTNRMVFESKDKKQSWDGTYFNQGNACKEGQYYFVITYRYGLLDPVREENGFVKLIR